MTPNDLNRVSEISDVVHREYRETAEIYGERLRLWPQGCYVWEEDEGVSGLLVAHPWPRHSSPKLGEYLGRIPAVANSLYLHDVALLPQVRGKGAGGAATQMVFDLAKSNGFNEVTLVAVHGADSYWASQGFQVTDEGESYGPGSYRMTRAL